MYNVNRLCIHFKRIKQWSDVLWFNFVAYLKPEIFACLLVYLGYTIHTIETRIASRCTYGISIGGFVHSIIVGLVGAFRRDAALGCCKVFNSNTFARFCVRVMPFSIDSLPGIRFQLLDLFLSELRTNSQGEFRMLHPCHSVFWRYKPLETVFHLCFSVLCL